MNKQEENSGVEIIYLLPWRRSTWKKESKSSFTGLAKERRSVKMYLPVSGHILHVIPKIQDKYFYFLKTPKILSYNFCSLCTQGFLVYLRRFSLLFLITLCPRVCALSGLTPAIGTIPTQPWISMPFLSISLLSLKKKMWLIVSCVCMCVCVCSLLNKIQMTTQKHSIKWPCNQRNVPLVQLLCSYPHLFQYKDIQFRAF